jgi:ribonuclease E
MAKRMMLVDAAHPEETRVVVLNGNRLEEFDFETSTKKQIKGNIYLAKVTRVEPSLQAAFVEYGGNRHGFLAFNEIHPDYYRIPVADRRAALEAERVAEHAAEAREDARAQGFHEPEPHDEPPPSAYDDGDDDEAEPDDGGPERMAHTAPAETIRSEESAFDEPEHESAPEPTEARASDESSPAPIAEPVGEAPPASFDDAAPPSDLFAPHGESDEHESDAGGLPAVIEARHGEPAGEPQHDITIETLGGDELEETTRPRARPFRHYKIQEVIKRRQIMLVQVAKEERGNKGAALTTYLSLAGRYCVLMPNTPRGGGVSRKITNAGDRRRLKELVSDLEVPDGMGVIVRTAGSERSKAEIKRDFEYLMRLWDEIRDLTLKSTAPALIYEEGNLIKRSIRDLYTRDIDEVIVDGEEGYRTAKDFMKMLMPSHAKRVKAYRDPSVPLFHRFQVESQIDAIHSPIVQLRSGGYIVINPTEALVAIDVNSGRSTKERNIEETALKTNLEAAEEVARQLRLRDLAGLIVVDFIDMEEYRNRGAVERRLKESMRHDRARIQLGRISPFGLLELSRQRLRPSLLEASTQPCPHCGGTGHIRSIESTALHVLRAIEEEGMRRRSAEISVAVPARVGLYVLNQKRTTLQQIEQRFGIRVFITTDESLIPPAFRLDRLRALTPAEVAALPSFAPPPEPDEEEDEEVVAEEFEETDAVSVPIAEAPPQQPEREHARASEDENGQGRRRRRPRRRGRRDEGREREARPQPQPARAVPQLAEAEVESDGEEPIAAAPRENGQAKHADEQKRRRRGRRGGRRRRRGPGEGPSHDMQETAMAPEAETVEFVADEPMHVPEEPTRDIAEAFAATPEQAEIYQTESVPVADGNELAAQKPEPEPEPEHAEAPATIHYNVPPPREVTGHAAAPRRGWWRR